MLRSIKILAVSLIIATSCTHKPGTIDVYVIGKETCNMTDENGKRQGKWVPNYNNDLKDTVYYKDDSIIKP